MHVGIEYYSMELNMLVHQTECNPVTHQGRTVKKTNLISQNADGCRTGEHHAWQSCHR